MTYRDAEAERYEYRKLMVAKVRLLLAERPYKSKELAKVLQCTEAYTQGLISSLRREKVIHTEVGEYKNKEFIYSVVPPLDTAPIVGRRFLMLDDAPFLVRENKTAIQRDPMVAAFFGGA